MASGKTRRLRRILREDGRTLIIAMDHGISMGPIAGLEDMRNAVSSVVAGGADAVLVHKGVARQLDGPSTGLIVHVSASTKLGPKPNTKVSVCTVEEAVRLGADAVSVHINVGSEGEEEMLQLLAGLAEESEQFGMPLLAMMYPRGPSVKSEHDLEVVAHAARIGAELGADIIKTNYTGDPESFRRVVRACHVPVVIAGGPRMKTDEDVFEMVKGALAAGAAGLSMGRNVFQHANPTAMTNALAEMVHKSASPAEAARLLGAGK